MAWLSLAEHLSNSGKSHRAPFRVNEMMRTKPPVVTWVLLEQRRKFVLFVPSLGKNADKPQRFPDLAWIQQNT